MLMPDARYILQLIDHIAAVIEANGLDFGDLIGIGKLLGLELMMISPSAEKIFKGHSTGYLYVCAFRKLFFVDEFLLRHGLLVISEC